MRRNLVMQQFRASPESRARWDAIPRPIGAETFSDLVRLALNDLWNRLVRDKWEPGKFQRHHKGECTTCFQKAVVDKDSQCIVCWMRVQPPAVEVPAAKPAVNGTAATKVRGQKRPAKAKGKPSRTTRGKAARKVGV